MFQCDVSQMRSDRIYVCNFAAASELRAGFPARKTGLSMRPHHPSPPQ